MERTLGEWLQADGKQKGQQVAQLESELRAASQSKEVLQAELLAANTTTSMLQAELAQCKATIREATLRPGTGQAANPAAREFSTSRITQLEAQLQASEAAGRAEGNWPKLEKI